MLLPVLMFAMMQSPAYVPTGQRGFDLLQNCLTTLRFIDGPAENRTEGMAAESNICTGYVGGFVEGLEMQARPAVCPGDVGTGTVIRLYVEYMKKHPEDNPKVRGVGLAGTLLEYYPCVASKPLRGSR